MSVAYVSTRSLAPATGTGNTSASWTIAGPNLAIIVYIANHSNVGAVTVVSWSLGSGTPVEVKKNQIGNTGCFVSVWAIPAPTAGAGTYTVTTSPSSPYQITADLFSGAHQTVPCPTGDAVVAGSINFDGTQPVSLSPTNVGANDACCGGVANVSSGDALGWTTGIQTFLDDTTTINFETAYRLGAVPIVSVPAQGVPDLSAVAVRVQGAATTIPDYQVGPQAHFAGVGVGF